MDKNSFRKSLEFDDIFKELINLQNPSMSWIQKNWNLSFQKTMALYVELRLYNDDEFLQNALYELRHEYEPPTICRIMGKFHISYYLAGKLFQMYMEDC